VIGVSNFSPTQMRMFRADAQLDAVRPPYNLFEREIDVDVLPYAEDTGLTVLSDGALCRGLLSGRMTADTKFEGDDLRKVDPKFQGTRFPQYLAAVDELKKPARERFGKSVLALAVRWVLDQGPTIALWGARHPGHWPTALCRFRRRFYLSRKVPKRMLCRSSLVNTTSRWRIEESQESEGDFFGAGERWSAMVGGALLFPKFGHSLAGGHFRTH
jgi:aryl-alcohol dehydrogenase-like predicted oxidoreductase